MSAPSSADILPNIGTLTGPMLLGHLFNWSLLGTLSLQVYIYAVSFPEDKLGFKALVYFLFFVDLLQTAFATHSAWYALAGGWGNLLVFNVTPWTLAALPPLCGSVALLVQGFFAWRIWKLSQGNRLYFPILAVIGITAIGSCVAVWYIGIATVSLHGIGNASTKSLLNPEFTAWLASSMVCDSVITITLVWQLSRRRSEGFGSVNHIVHRAIRMTVETGALTTAVSAIELILFLNSSLATWYLMFALMIGKLYTNSLLATLNVRSPTSQKSSPTSTSSVHLWDRSGELRGEKSTSTADVVDIRNNDIELGSVQQKRSTERMVEFCDGNEP